MDLTQGQSSASKYFIKLKTIWEELSNYRRMHSCEKCNCGSIKKLAEHYHMDYFMSFLMRLNDSFAQVRGQLLLMDPIFPMTKVFAHISQEEHQMNVNVNASTADSIAFYVKNDAKNPNIGSSYYKYQKKKRCVNTYCGYAGHVVDTSYKLHGYSSGYKTK